MNWLATTVIGLVIEVHPEARTMVVSHQEIAGVMPAMTMPVRVSNARELRGIQPGAMIEFHLDNGVARRLRVRQAANEIEQEGRRIALPRPREKVALGAGIPDFELTDQQGRTVKLSRLGSSVVAVQFLYTRCPMPEVCPRLAATFARLQQRFATRHDLMLLSITLDPVYDTPEILSRYATTWRANYVSWRFLTGSEAQIRTAAGHFGVVYWPEEGVITHTSTIGIVGRGGRLASVVEGLSFTARQLGDLIEHELERERKR
ncbi:MAG TPA: SCO family protein [Bryobacteraceae bacterium]|nr:SCO family protein [Bryobacteraceae bacterium]